MAKINSEQLSKQLAQAKQNLQPVYLVSGDEILLVQDAVQALRARAIILGFTERCLLTVDARFDWDLLNAHVMNLSLFGDKKFIELRLSSDKIGDEGSQAVRDYVATCPNDCLLVVVAPKLDSSVQRAKWVVEIESKGAHVQIWPVEATRLPAWLQQRARLKGLTLSEDGLRILADKIEGNLLAADQELEKLLLLNGTGRLDDELVKQSITDSARFNVYTLVDYCLYGQVEKLAHVLQGLRAEGVEPVLILWALAREIRTLLAMRERMDAGVAVEAVLAEFRVWDRRKSMTRSVLLRCTSRLYYSMLAECAKIDLQIKGLASGSTWNSLLRLCVEMAGSPLFTAQKAQV